jgi:hypothetical protein
MIQKILPIQFVSKVKLRQILTDKWRPIWKASEIKNFKTAWNQIWLKWWLIEPYWFNSCESRSWSEWNWCKWFTRSQTFRTMNFTIFLSKVLAALILTTSIFDEPTGFCVRFSTSCVLNLSPKSPWESGSNRLSPYPLPFHVFGKPVHNHCGVPIVMWKSAFSEPIDRQPHFFTTFFAVL